MSPRPAALACFALCLAAAPLDAQVQKDIEYARAGDHRLLLDLYRPSSNAERPPLVVYIHGGAWRRGSKDKVPIKGLLKHGYAIASVAYRLSPVAKFPAQAHDIKAAIRFLRARQNELNIDARRIGIAGASAGGHLVALIGTTNGHQALEGKLGDHPDQSSDVQAIVDYYGPTNFMTILKQSTPHGLSVRVPALDLLLGGRPEKHEKIARLGSPVFHVDSDDPPLMMIHGDQDPQVPINQSHELHGAYKKVGAPVVFEVVHGGAHGGPGFYETEPIERVAGFLDKHIRR